MPFRLRGAKRPDRTCTVCGATYPAGRFADHRASNPNAHPAYRPRKIERPCTVCGQSYPPGGYDAHRLTHAKLPQTCRTCGATFTGTIRAHNDVCLPTRIWVRRPEVLDMERRRRLGESLTAIAAAHGVTSQRVDQLLRTLADQRKRARSRGMKI